MNTGSRHHQQLSHRTVQVICLLYSIIFVALIWTGYFLLFQSNVFIGALIGAVFALMAWFIAKFIGTEERGIKRYTPLFILLLTVSAIGVFNSMMLNLEGKKIFQETLADSEVRVRHLQSYAQKNISNPAVEARIAKVESLTEALIKELRNPLNCGQGPEARDLIRQIQQELPSFRQLTEAEPNGSTKAAINCSKVEIVIASYKDLIKTLIEKAPWYTAANYGALLKDRAALIASTNRLLENLKSLSGDVSRGMAGTLPSLINPKLRVLDSEYRNEFQIARFYGATDIPNALDLSSVENLGQWSQLINLIIARADRPQTYVYLCLAIFVDWLMIYVFSLLRTKAQNLPARKSPSAVKDALNAGP